MKLKCIVIDDEPLALQLIQKYSEQIPFLELIGTYINPLEALTILNEKKIDLIFLDIRMPDLNGFQFLNSLQHKPRVILTTAYNQYGPESYEFDIVDYLLKPISFEKFLRAVSKARDIENLSLQKWEESQLKVEEESIFVNSEYKLIKIKIRDIVFIEGLKDYIKIYVEGNAKPILTIMRIKTFEENLPGSDFIRLHRSYLININKIDYIKKNRVYIGKYEIPIGEMYGEGFFKLIEDRNWK